MNARRVPVLVALAMLSVIELRGCVLVVESGEPVAAECRFDGDDRSACGRCLAKSCQRLVNDCCRAGEACEEALGMLDACASRGAGPECGRLAGLGSSSASTAGEKLGRCVANACAAVCPAGEPLTGCGEYSGSCRCEGDDPPNDVVCADASVENGFCCADLGWPGRGLSCSCEQFECRQTEDGCECSAHTSGPLAECSGTYCCVYNATCECGNTPCHSFETRVDRCSTAVIGCDSDETRVSSCSRRE